jgi:hypothetical protein
VVLEQGVVYVTPDGRRFRADLDTYHDGTPRFWRLVPIGVADAKSRGALELLFVGRGRVVRIDLTARALVVDTGWTYADLRRG